MREPLAPSACGAVVKRMLKTPLAALRTPAMWRTPERRWMEPSGAVKVMAPRGKPVALDHTPVVGDRVNLYSV